MTRSLAETNAQRADRRSLLSELRKIDHQAALDARLARSNTLRAFTAAARMMRADLPSGRSVSRRHFKAGARAINFPKPPPRSYARTGVSYVHARQMRDGLRHTPFHLRVTQCNHGGRAVAHQAYIERESAVVYQVGTISDDPDERRDFWRQIAARASLRRGTISLPREANPALRDALRPLLEAMEHDGKLPPRVTRAWLHNPRGPLAIRQLDQDQYEYAATTIADAYQAIVDDTWSAPRAAGKPPGLPPGFGAYSPRSPQVQRRMVLELPHEVLPEARERILRRFCSRVFEARAIPYHAVIHSPAEGNDSRNWHAHIVSTHHDIRRDPATGQWDFLAHDRLPPVHAFGQIITGNARGADGRPLPSRKDKADKMKGLFREIREDFSALANGELMLAAATRRYDPRSYRNQGIDVVPALHVGPGGTGIGKRGAVAGRTPHQAAWMNVANAIAVALPEEDPDDIRDTLELEQIVRTVPDPNALFQPPAGPLFLALQRPRSTADLLDETVEALDRLPDPPHRLAVAEPNVVPQRLPSPIQATGRPSATALGDAPGRTAIAEPDIRPQPIEIRGAVQRSPMPTAHALQEPPHHLAVAEPDVRPQRLPSAIQATVRPSSAALGDAPGRTVIAEPDIRPQPIENPVAVQRSPMPTAHSLPDPPRRLTVAEPDVRPQRLPSPIQATVRPSSAALGDAPGRTVIAEPDIRPQPIENPVAVQRSPMPTAHSLPDPPHHLAVAEPDVRPQRLPSAIQATGRPSPAALGDAPGRTVIAEPDIRPQPIENPVAVQRSPMPTAHSLPDPPRHLTVAEPDVRPQRLPSAIQATGRPSPAALGDAPGRTVIAEPDIRPQPIENPVAVQRSPMPTAHSLPDPPRHLTVAEPDVRPQRLPSAIQATGRPSPAALGDAPGRTVIAEPDIRPQPIENPVAVQRSPMPTAHSLPDPPRRLTVAEPDVRPQRLPSPIQATGRPSPAALGDAPRRTVIAEPDIRPQPIEIRGAVQRSPAPTPHALQEPPRRIAVAEPDVRPQQLNRDEIPVRDPAVPETAPAIADEQALAQHLRPHLRDLGVAVLHALRSRSSLHLPPLPGLGPEALHHIALTLASHQALHSSDNPLHSWHTFIDTRPRFIRVLPLHLARTAWPIHQLEQHLASPATPDTEAATRALLRTHRTALVTAALLAPHLEDHERPPTVPGLAPDASAAAFRLLRKSLRHRVPRDPSGIYAALKDANKTAELHLDDIARLIHQHGLDGSLDLLAPPKPHRPRGTSVQR